MDQDGTKTSDGSSSDVDEAGSLLIMLHFVAAFVTCAIVLPAAIIWKPSRKSLLVSLHVSLLAGVGLVVTSGYMYPNPFTHPRPSSQSGLLVVAAISSWFVSQVLHIWATDSGQFVKGAKLASKLRRSLSLAQRLLERLLFPILLLLTVELALIETLGVCRPENAVQCAGHFAVGSVGTLYSVVLFLSTTKTARQSPEFLDGMLHLSWGGLAIAFGHIWGNPWDAADVEHALLGTLALAGGCLGLWFSKDSSGRPTRNIYPALTWLLVGYVLGNHHHVDGHTEQSNIEVLNAAIHSVVAKIVTILGALRLAEILTSHDGPRPATNATFAMQWQHIRVLPSLLVSIAGLLMFCAEKGLLLKFANQHLDVSVLVLGATCVAALLHFYVYALLYLSEKVAAQSLGYSLMVGEET